MERQELIKLESDWLPQSELERMVSQFNTDYPSLMVEPKKKGVHRSMDPVLAEVLISGASAILVPLVTRIINWLFDREPKAKVLIQQETDAGLVEITIHPATPLDTRNNQLKQMLSDSANLPKIKVTIESKN